MTPQIDLTEARNTGATVTVVLDNGIRMVGTVQAAKDDPGLVRVVSPGTTWSRTIHPDDVVEVIFE